MSEIWSTNSIRLLTSLCNIPLNSVLHCFRIDYAVNGDRNLVGLSVVFQKSPSRHLKHKSPSTLRRNKLRKEIRQQRRSQQQGLGIQASSSSLSTVNPTPLSLISGKHTTKPDSSFNTSSESKTTINTNASSTRIDHPSSSASSVAPQLSGRPIGTTSSSAFSYSQATTSSSTFQSPSRRSMAPASGGPLLVLRATLDDGTVVRKRLSSATSSSSLSSSSRAATAAPVRL